MPERVIQIRDEVKHKHNDVSGIVISKYLIGSELLLDVRSDDDKIYYCTPIKNWSTVRAVEDIE